VSTAQPLSLEGRLAPEDDTERRAVQVLTAGDKGERLSQENGRSLFVQVLLDGLTGMADRNKNGWLMASEVGAYVKQQVGERSNGLQHPLFVQLEGDGDTVLIEGRTAAFLSGAVPRSPAERRQAAKMRYEQAFALLQSGKSSEEALALLNRALEYDSTFGDAYVLKSYILLEVLPDLDGALSAAMLAMQYAPKNPDSPYTLGLIYEKRGQYAQAERAMREALVVNQVEIHLGRLACFYDGTLDQCQEKKMTPLAWSPLGGGWLGSGGKTQDARLLSIQKAVDEMAAKYDVSRSVLSLAWLLKHPSRIIPIVGSSNPAHIKDATKAEEVDLSRDDWYRLLVVARGEKLP